MTESILFGTVFGSDRSEPTKSGVEDRLKYRARVYLGSGICIVFDENPAGELVPADWARSSFGEPVFEAAMADDVFAGETDEEVIRTDARSVAMTVFSGVKALAADGAFRCRVEVKLVDRGYCQEEPLRFGR